MTVPFPRQPDAIKADLRRLLHQRTEAQDKLVALLTTLDALDSAITIRLDELARNA